MAQFVFQLLLFGNLATHLAGKETPAAVLQISRLMERDLGIVQKLVNRIGILGCYCNADSDSKGDLLMSNKKGPMSSTP